MKLFITALFTLSFVGFSVMAEQVVIVNPANSAEVNKKVISRIFLGKVKNFTTGSAASPVNLKSGGTGRDEFDKKLLGKSSSQIKAYWSKLIFTGKGKPPKELLSDAEVKAFIASDVSGIGYIDGESVDDSVKVVLKF